MTKINGKMVYNIRSPLGMGDGKNRLKEDGCCSCHPRKLLQLSTEEPRRRISPWIKLEDKLPPFPPRVLIIPSTYDHVQLLQPSLKPSSWAYSLPNLLYWARWVWAYSLNSKSTQTLTLKQENNYFKAKNFKYGLW